MTQSSNPHPGSQEFALPPRRQIAHPAQQGFADAGLRLRLRPLQDALLEDAQERLKTQDFNMAIVISQTAIEVSVNRIFYLLLQSRGSLWVIEKLLDPLTFNYDPSMSSVRKIYHNLSQDTGLERLGGRLERQKRIRNSIAHQGHRASKDQAVAYYRTADEIVEYLRSYAK